MLNQLYKKILLIIVLLSPLSLNAASFSGMVVFGDSLSDNGNLAVLPNYAFLNQAPYQHGFNNGQPAVAQLAQLLNLPLNPSLYLTGQVVGNNFAVAGARAAGNSAIDLSNQVNAFLGNQAGQATADKLYIIFIGGNDIRDMRNQTNDAQATALLNSASTNIKMALTKLIDAGAKNILVVNAPDIGMIPETQLLAAAYNNPALITKATENTTAFNKKLAQTVSVVEKKKAVDIIVFNLKGFFSSLAKNNKAYLFDNTKQACYSSDTFNYYPPCDATTMDSFLFFDEIHPSQRVHQRLGRALFAIVPEAN